MRTALAEAGERGQREQSHREDVLRRYMVVDSEGLQRVVTGEYANEGRAVQAGDHSVQRMLQHFVDVSERIVPCCRPGRFDQGAAEQEHRAVQGREANLVVVQETHVVYLVLDHGSKYLEQGADGGVFE